MNAENGGNKKGREVEAEAEADAKAVKRSNYGQQRPEAA